MALEWTLLVTKWRFWSARLGSLAMMHLWLYGLDPIRAYRAWNERKARCQIFLWLLWASRVIPKIDPKALFASDGEFMLIIPSFLLGGLLLNGLENTYLSFDRGAFRSHSCLPLSRNSGKHPKKWEVYQNMSHERRRIIDAKEEEGSGTGTLPWHNCLFQRPFQAIKVFSWIVKRSQQAALNPQRCSRWIFPDFPQIMRLSIYSSIHSSIRE